MNKKIKTILFSSIIYLSWISLTFGASAINGGSSNVADGSLVYKSFSQNVLGTGVSIGTRFNLVENIFTDLEENSKVKDHIFGEIEVFGNQFFSGEIKHNYGGRLNLGYEIKGIRIYGSGGYVSSSVDYQETNNVKQSINESAPFFGLGLGYDITKNIGLRLNSMFYNFDFKPKNSGYKGVEVNVLALTFGLAVHF